MKERYRLGIPVGQGEAGGGGGIVRNRELMAGRQADRQACTQAEKMAGRHTGRQLYR